MLLSTFAPQDTTSISMHNLFHNTKSNHHNSPIVAFVHESRHQRLISPILAKICPQTPISRTHILNAVTTNRRIVRNLFRYQMYSFIQYDNLGACKVGWCLIVFLRLSSFCTNSIPTYLFMFRYAVVSSSQLTHCDQKLDRYITFSNVLRFYGINF